MPTALGESGSGPRRAAGAGQHRDGVGAGRTRPVFDLAAAPVRTDSESGGQGTAHDQLRSGPPEAVAADHTNPGRGQQQIPDRRMAWLVAVGFAFLILLGLTAAIVTLP